MSAIMYRGKVYGAGGSGGGGGASAISNLTDVDLDNLSDGQILKWNATAQKWENANESGGGGGTEVIANPTGEPTAELTKVSIGGVIYSLPQGGGSGGTNLFEINYVPKIQKISASGLITDNAIVSKVE